MNTLLFALYRALRRYAWLRLMLGAYLFTSLGNGLTQVLIFGQLLQWHASSTALTLAWLLAIIPGFISSLCGEILCRRFSPLLILSACEWLGLFALLLPMAGLYLHSTPLLLTIQSVEAFLTGLSWPALALVFKRGLASDELPAATAMENLVFASRVLLGTGAGVLLFGHVDPLILLVIDAGSFVIAATLLLLTLDRWPMNTEDRGEPLTISLRWQGMNNVQKRSLLLLPALAAVGAPAMALLPAMAQQLRPEQAAALALPLLFSRSMGQLCGPMLLNSQKMVASAQSNWLLTGCLGLFLLCYGVMPLLTAMTPLALLAIFIAHVSSNVVFALGSFSVLRHFTARDISSASAKACRWQMVSATLVTSLTVLLTTMMSATQTLYLVSSCSLLLVSFMLARYR